MPGKVDDNKRSRVEIIPYWLTGVGTILLVGVCFYYAMHTKNLWVQSVVEVNALKEQIRLSIAPNSIPNLEKAPKDLELLTQLLALYGQKSELEKKITDIDLTKNPEKIAEYNDLQDKLIGVQAQISKLEETAEVDYILKVYNPTGQMSLSVCGYIYDHYTYIPGDEILDIIEGGSEKTINFNLDNAKSRELIKEEIEKDWRLDNIGDILASEVTTEFLNSTDKSNILLIYNDVQGNIYITIREVYRDEKRGLICGPLRTDFLPSNPNYNMKGDNKG